MVFFISLNPKHTPNHFALIARVCNLHSFQVYTDLWHNPWRSSEITFQKDINRVLFQPMTWIVYTGNKEGNEAIHSQAGRRHHPANQQKLELVNREASWF